MCGKHRGYTDEHDNCHFQGTIGLSRETDPEIIAIQLNKCIWGSKEVLIREKKFRKKHHREGDI